jgi:hypothetical protein
MYDIDKNIFLCSGTTLKIKKSKTLFVAKFAVLQEITVAKIQSRKDLFIDRRMSRI